MAIGNEEHTQECFPNGNSKNEIRQRNRRRFEERRKKRKSKAGTKEKRSPDGLNYNIAFAYVLPVSLRPE